MKKAYLIIIALLAIFAISAFLYYTAETEIIADESQYDIWRIVAYMADGDEIDLTDSVDMEAVTQLLAEYNQKVSKVNISRYFTEDLTYEINGRYGGESLHILLGNLNVAYSSSSEGGHQIVNGQGLLEKMHQLLEVKPDPEPTGNELSVLQTLTADPTITILDYVPMDDMAYDKVGIVCYTEQGDDTIYISYLTQEYESKVGLGASGELSLLSECQLVYIGNGVSKITLQSKETGEDVVYTVEFWLDGIEPHFEISSSDYVSDPQPITPDQLAYFNEIYFNETMGQSFNYANQFLHSLFASPADIDLYNLFYHGAGADYTMSEDGEFDAVAQSYGFAGWAEIPTDVTPIPATSMDDFLTYYTGTTLAESNQIGLDSFKYLEEYNCYYNLHGDTNYYGTVTFTDGTIQGDTLRLSYHNSWQGEDYVLTLTSSGENYLISSNLPMTK